MRNPPYHTMYPSWAFLGGSMQRHSEIEKASLYSNPMFCIYEIFLSISISSLQHFVSTTEKRNRRIFSFEIWECDCVYMTIKCRSTQTTTTAIAISYAPSSQPEERNHMKDGRYIVLLLLYSGEPKEEEEVESWGRGGGRGWWEHCNGRWGFFRGEFRTISIVWRIVHVNKGLGYG